MRYDGTTDMYLEKYKYAMLSKKSELSKDSKAISHALINTDKTVEKAFSFIIENSVLPRISDLERTVN